MSDKKETAPNGQSSRRKFIKNSSLLVAGGAVAGQLSFANTAHAFGSDEIKIGLIGCGGRGTGAASQAMNTEGATKLVAMADAFGDRLQQSLRGLKGEHKEKVDVPTDRQFVGFDAFKHVLESDADLVILATPPGFRPLHLESAINAGNRFTVFAIVTTLQSNLNRKVLLFGFSGCLQDFANTCRIHCHRLFTEHMLPRFD